MVERKKGMASYEAEFWGSLAVLFSSDGWISTIKDR